MTGIKPELIEKAAQALHDLRSMRSRALHEIGQPLGDTVCDNERRADARAALEAVADDIRAEGAAQALRDAVNADGFTVRDSLGYHFRAVATGDLLARADRVEARDA